MPVPRAAVLLLLVPLLSACAPDVLGAAPQPTPSSLGACPAVPGEPPPTDCTPYDPDAATAANEAYRQRAPGPTAGPRLEEQARRVEVVLEELARTVPQPTGRQAHDALVAAGFPSGAVQAWTSGGAYDQPSAALAVGVDLGGTCLVGELRDGRADVAPAGGHIADGGCLAIEGH